MMHDGQLIGYMDKDAIFSRKEKSPPAPVLGTSGIAGRNRNYDPGLPSVSMGKLPSNRRTVSAPSAVAAPKAEASPNRFSNSFSLGDIGPLVAKAPSSPSEPDNEPAPKSNKRKRGISKIRRGRVAGPVKTRRIKRVKEEPQPANNTPKANPEKESKKTSDAPPAKSSGIGGKKALGYGASLAAAGALGYLGYRHYKKKKNEKKALENDSSAVSR